METESSISMVKILHRSPDTLELFVSGDCNLYSQAPDIRILKEELEGKNALKNLVFDLSGLNNWDSRLTTFLVACCNLCRQYEIQYDLNTLPKGLHGLIALAEAVPEKTDTRLHQNPSPFLERVGLHTQQSYQKSLEIFTFIGECLIALVRMVTGRARFRWSDVALTIQECGAEALGIVALISFLIGLILAFVGAVQLQQFGAAIYVADLVGIAMVREMGCIMTGIIMSGRTGAAFAAQLGSMKVNEEIDAFRTFGFSAVEFLVLPKMLALILMMPLLTVFADFFGILGGFVVGLGMLDLSYTEYFNETVSSISLTNFFIGIVKGSFFGILVAISGCLRGMQCGNNSAAVGLATTSAVVSGITTIIVADAVFAVLFNALKI